MVSGILYYLYINGIHDTKQLATAHTFLVYMYVVKESKNSC